VNSKRGTQFRIWATKILRDHIIQGYTVNERRLRELDKTVKLIAGVVERRDLSGDEARALLQVVSEYSHALDLLDDYDHQRVEAPDRTSDVIHILSYEEALRIVDRCVDGLANLLFSALKRIKVWRVLWAQLCRPSTGMISIRASKRKRPICSIS
jgi:hypothetical protein